MRVPRQRAAESRYLSTELGLERERGPGRRSADRGESGRQESSAENDAAWSAAAAEQRDTARGMARAVASAGEQRSPACLGDH